MVTSRNKYLMAVTSLANRMDAKLKAAFLDAIDRLKNKNIDWAKAQSMMDESRPDLLMDYLSTELIKNSFSDYAVILGDAFIAGGKLAASLAPPFTSGTGAIVNVVFNSVNPALAGAMHEYQMQSITAITEDIRQVIRTVLSRAISEGIGPRESMREIRSFIGLTSGQARAVENYRQALNEKPLQALNNALRDKRFDRTVTAADFKSEALSQAQIDKMVVRYQERFLDYRATTIARTESIRALNMANKQLWQGYIDDGKIDEHRLIKKWIYSQDDRTRAAHDGRTPEGISSMNPDGVPFNEPFKSMYGDIQYPGDPEAEAANTINCRCTMFIRVRG